MSIVITEDQAGAEEFGIYKLYRVANVADYTLDNESFNSWKITLASLSNADIYLCIDTFFHEAVSHWVFESAVYLPLFLDLKASNPDIKLHIKGPPKRYKAQFCALFGIEPTYELSAGATCLFPNPISAQNRRTLNVAFEPQLRRFIDVFRIIETPPPSIDFLILPRGRAENFKPNDRTIDFGELNVALDKSVKVNTWAELNVDNINRLHEQIGYVRSAKNIVVCDGAAFFINALFAKGAIIHIIGNMTSWQSDMFPNVGLARSIINYGNKNTYKYTDIPSVITQLCADE